MKNIVKNHVEGAEVYNSQTEQNVNGVWQTVRQGVMQLSPECVFSEQWAFVFRITGLALH